MEHRGLSTQGGQIKLTLIFRLCHIWPESGFDHYWHLPKDRGRDGESNEGKRGRGGGEWGGGGGERENERYRQILHFIILFSTRNCHVRGMIFSSFRRERHEACKTNAKLPNVFPAQKVSEAIGKPLVLRSLTTQLTCITCNISGARAPVSDSPKTRPAE